MYAREEMEEIRRHWSTWFAVGLVMAVVGLIALWTAAAATLVSAVLIGAALVVSGIGQIVAGLRERERSRGQRLFFFVWGVLELVVGVLVALFPVASALALTLVIGAMLLAGGILRLVFATANPELPGRGWALLAGGLNIALGLLVVAQWPFSGLWFLGLAVGISLLFNGVAMATLAWNVRHAPRVSMP